MSMRTSLNKAFSPFGMYRVVVILDHEIGNEAEDILALADLVRNLICCHRRGLLSSILLIISVICYAADL